MNTVLFTAVETVFLREKETCARRGDFSRPDIMVYNRADKSAPTRHNEIPPRVARLLK